MNGAFVGDLEQLVALAVEEITLEVNGAAKLIDKAGAAITALGTVVGVDLVVVHLYDHAGQRDLASLGVHPQRHRCARTQRGGEQIIRRGSSIESADRFGFIGEESVPPCDDMIQIETLRRLSNHNLRGGGRCRGSCSFVDNVPLSPGRDHA